MKITREAKIGLFAVVCLAVLFWGLNFLKGRNVFSRTNIYYAIYSRVDGLKPTNDVILSGFKIGSVKSIAFDDMKKGELVVTLLIEKKYQIPLNSEAKLVSADIMGGKAIRLDLSNSTTFHKQGDTLVSSIETGIIDQLIYEMGPIKDKAEKLIVEMDQMLVNINEILNDENKDNINHSFESLRSSLAHLNSMSKSIDRMLNADDGEIQGTLSNLNEFSLTLKNNSAGIDTIVGNLAALSDTLVNSNISRILSQSDSAIFALNQLVSKINSGEGSMGVLLQNDTLYYNLEQSIKNLELLLYDMRVNPKRYINFSLFDFSRSRYIEKEE
ncbi:MAG: MlaD family protein [Bacteroidales bacterium]|nr:MlaD family protein [Bacteroidales bacterium]MDD4673271.1 MlaD family protein [Bacteroidales bacterium]